ncbi:hypothetical protein EXIGLDRAFT_768152 [Exidia glandulosa HHB12029]|uniref:Arrestin-like N-terminal domain-containing protein n=1 Tax=Exidia glandulosa HHB12029 TaxID=1314781 RepID=A0A165IGR1_EXIGL|nr:hypothetical protein EXIGLDRAFT_768152 [Exidia glandulosa HHB12029]
MSLALAQPPAYELAQTPSYAVLPRSGEQRLALSGRMPTRAIRSGTFEKRSKRLVLALYEQRAEGEVPVIDRGGWVSGCVGLLERAQEVQKVEVKIDGVLYGQTSRAGSTMSSNRSLTDGKMKLMYLSESLTLWEKKSQTNTTCPTEIPFRHRLPKTFFDNQGNEWLIPPTFETNFKGMYGFMAYSRCTISVILTVPRGLDKFWSKDTSLSTPFVLQARTRPPFASIEMSSRLLETLKSAPEAWSQHNFTVQTTDTLVGQLYISKPTAYCMNDPIPFHLQLTGESAALAFFQLSQPAMERGSVQVSILRHISVAALDGDVVHRVPGGRSNQRLVSQSPGLLSWEGELIADADTVNVGSFRVGPISMTDYVSITIDPPPSKKTQKIAFIQTSRRFQIVLTTDRWQDMGEAGPSYEL